MLGRFVGWTVENGRFHSSGRIRLRWFYRTLLCANVAGGPCQFDSRDSSISKSIQANVKVQLARIRVGAVKVRAGELHQSYVRLTVRSACPNMELSLWNAILAVSL